MKLLVIRHAVAMDQEEFARTGQSDDLRPLTVEGKREMEQVAVGLRAEVKTLDVLATSPLERARQTAVIVATAYEIGPTEVTDSLVPGASLESFEVWCDSLGNKKTIAVVGHEPHLSRLIDWEWSELRAYGNALDLRHGCRQSHHRWSLLRAKRRVLHEVTPSLPTAHDSCTPRRLPRMGVGCGSDRWQTATPTLFPEPKARGIPSGRSTERPSDFLQMGICSPCRRG